METPQPARSVLSLLGLLALATVLGVATAFALAGIAMLLAAPAYAAENEEPGCLMLRGAGGTSPAPLVSTEVVFRVAGPVARARVVQTFRNPYDDWYEGVYVFPLPENGAVDRLRLVVGSRVVEGEIRERPNMFTARVANIGPRDTIVVELEYQQLLRYDGGRFSLRFPMAIGPRYIAGPLRVADAERITPPVMRPGTRRRRFA
jgi:Ca-activated chloride channel homolog